MDANVHKGHRQRVKKRYMNEGLNGFEDHQVLELLLFYCYAQKDTNKIAHKMINEFGSIGNLFEAHPLEISQKCNVTENVAILVSLVPHLAKRYYTSRWGPKHQLDSSAKAGQYCTGLFAGMKYECFYLICLDNQRQLIYADCIHQGTVDSAPVYPRIIVECALKYRAASVIIAHNHPSGKLIPSRSDIEVTKKIVAALETVDIDVIDHIIVGGASYFSFSEKRLLHMVY